jgi:hypothetical protein
VLEKDGSLSKTEIFSSLNKYNIVVECKQRKNRSIPVVFSGLNTV